MKEVSPGAKDVSICLIFCFCCGGGAIAVVVLLLLLLLLLWCGDGFIE